MTKAINITPMTTEKIKYYLLVTANPLSDKEAAITLFKIINRLDILAREVKIFLPGFHVSDKQEKDTSKEINAHIEELKSRNIQKDNEDYHGKDPIYHTYVESHGDIYFNDVDFSKFMRDFEDRYPNFEYLGRTLLVVLPSANGKILNDNIVSLNLDNLSQSKSKNDIEEFLLSVINLIRRDEEKETLDLISKIQEAYLKLSKNNNKEDEETAKVIIHLDRRLLDFMRWEEHDEIFFISYSKKDEFNAYTFKKLLEKNGKNVWMAPDGIPPGFDYVSVIQAALRITTRFVALLSHNSALSDWVRKEIGKAVTNRKRVDGIFLDNFTYEDVKSYDHLDFLFENIQLRYNIQDLLDNPESLKSFLE